MSLANYQTSARKTAIYPKEYKIIYPALGLAGEAGEVCNKIKKIFRDYDGNLTDEFREIISEEIGGVLWYVANLCTDLGLSMRIVGLTNLDILKSRQERGTLHGSGDDR